MFLWLVKNFLFFFFPEPEVSLSLSTEPSTLHCPNVVQLRLRKRVLFFETHFNIVIPSTCVSRVMALSGFPINLMYVSPSPCV